jgi:prefoldin subunit 5
VCGIDKLNTNLNHNEETIKYTVESRETILNYWKSGFETLIKNVQDIYFKSKYSNYNSSTVNLGTDYYLKDLNDVIEEQGKAKENGLNEIIDYNTQYITAKYQNDPEQRKRSLIVKNLAEALRPFNSENKEDVIELFKANKINSKQFTIYSNFFNWINTFEKTKDIELIEMDYNKLLIEFEKEIQNYLIKYKSDEQTN